MHVGCKHLWREALGNTPPALFRRWKSWLWSFWRQHDIVSSAWSLISVKIASVAVQFVSCDHDASWFLHRHLSTGFRHVWQRKWTNKSGPTGDIVLLGPRQQASFYSCITIRVVLIDLYHLHWKGTKHFSYIPRCTYLSSNSAETVSDPFFPQALAGVSFLSTAPLLLAGKEVRSRCSIKWQQFRKVDWTRLPEGPRGSGELWGEWFSQRYLVGVILAFTLM